MNMVRHDHSSVQIKLMAVFFEAAFEHDVFCRRRKFPSMICRERNEKRMLVLLIVR